MLLWNTAYLHQGGDQGQENRNCICNWDWRRVYSHFCRRRVRTDTCDYCVYYYRLLPSSHFGFPTRNTSEVLCGPPTKRIGRRCTPTGHRRNRSNLLQFYLFIGHQNWDQTIDIWPSLVGCIGGTFESVIPAVSETLDRTQFHDWSSQRKNICPL